jgi:flagellar biosynthesis GTPase FlhF
MSKLILGSTDIDILKALSRTHGNKPGKGEGQIFLLHGPPGTGKTYTVGKLHVSILVVVITFLAVIFLLLDTDDLKGIEY